MGEAFAHDVAPAFKAVESSAAEIRAAERAAAQAAEAAKVEKAAVSTTEAGSSKAVTTAKSTAKTGQDIKIGIEATKGASKTSKVVKYGLGAGALGGLGLAAANFDSVGSAFGDAGKTIGKGLTELFNDVTHGLADGCKDAEGGCPPAQAAEWMSSTFKTVAYVAVGIGGVVAVYEIYEWVAN